MLDLLFEGISGFLTQIEYAIVHMDSVQWSIVCIVAVVVGFLALRSKPA